MHAFPTKVWAFAAVTAILFATAGCTRTVHGGFDDSPGKKYRLYGRVYGAYGKPFLADTWKTIRITIVSVEGGEKLLFTKEYRFRGFNVSWDSKWDGDYDLTVTISNLPPGGGVNVSQGPGPQSENLRIFRYRFDLKAARFVESSSA